MHAAVSLHPDDACDLIRRKAKRAIERIDEIDPFRMTGPFELVVECFTAEQAQTWSEKLEGELVGKTCCGVRADNPLDLW